MAHRFAKQFGLGKYHGQNLILKKYGLERLDPKYVQLIANCESDDIRTFRRRLMSYESKFMKHYSIRFSCCSLNS